MNNMYKYVKTFGNLSFDEKGVTEVDILIFTQISYANFKDVVPNEGIGIKLNDAWETAKKNNEIIRGTSHNNAVKLLNVISKSIRYKDLILKNYEYCLRDDVQFGAVTIEVPNDYVYICFEGTDDSIYGWKEDFKMTYMYPIEAQKMAYRYLNREVRFSNSDVVISGHTKGGNLSLVGAMNMNLFKKVKIAKIYSFDGPGLKKKEFRSLNYRMIRKKLINVIPNKSIIGILLEQENLHVIKSFGLGIFQHDPATWVIDGDKFKLSTQDRSSKRLDKSINRWLEKHDYSEREEIIEGIFSIFEKAKIYSTYDMKDKKIKTFASLLKSSLDIDKETREVIIESFKILINDVSTDFIEDGKKIVTEVMEKHFKKKA